MKHEILWNNEIENDVYATTHPRITYDASVETFIVDLGKGAWVEVYGLNRFSRALQLADIDWEAYEDSYTK